jgi:hypothetical protein
MLYTVPPDLGQFHQMFDTGARPALVATAALGRRSDRAGGAGVVEQRYDAVKEVLDGQGR